MYLTTHYNKSSGKLASTYYKYGHLKNYIFSKSGLLGWGLGY